MRNPGRSHHCSTCFILLLHFHLFLNLTLAERFDPLIKLPQSGRTRTQSRTQRVLRIHSYGAKGDGVNDDTKAFSDAWKMACSSPSRSTIEIPADNSFLVRPIDFAGPCRSKVTLRIIFACSIDIWSHTCS